MKKPFLTVKIKCKPLVKSYLENNFGNPVNIPEEHIISKLACSQLVKDNARSNEFKDYTEQIDLMICERNFKFDGFNINEMNTRNFNTAVCSHIKDLLHVGIDSHLLRQDTDTEFKRKYFDLLEDIKAMRLTVDAATSKKITQLKNAYAIKGRKGRPVLSLPASKAEYNRFDISIKKTISTVIADVLKLDPDIFNLDSIKKDYWRFRKNKLSTQMSLNTI